MVIRYSTILITIPIEEFEPNPGRRTAILCDVFPVQTINIIADLQGIIPLKIRSY